MPVKVGTGNADTAPMAIRESEYGVRSVIETARLRLEPWSDAHFERFARFMRDPAVIRFIRAEPLDGDRALEQHERSLEEWDAFGFGKRALIEAETGHWVGFVELSRVGPGKGSRDDDIELGYFVEPSRWGEGIATEAALAARDEAFDRCGIAELIGRCRVENTASARVLAKIGFRRLRLFKLKDDIVVEIHRLERADWEGPIGRRELRIHTEEPHAATEYRETG
jgi:RimJ/RimL family protein N-acetyltransferase